MKIINSISKALILVLTFTTCAFAQYNRKAETPDANYLISDKVHIGTEVITTMELDEKTKQVYRLKKILKFKKRYAEYYNFLAIDSAFLRVVYPNGNIKREESKKNGKVVNGTCYDENGNIIPYFEFEIMPTFSGGDQALLNLIKKNTVYPPKALEFNIHGTVYVGYTVNKEGKITNIEISKSAHPLLDEEALRVIKLLPSYEKPGYLDGELANIQFNVPIKFGFAKK